MRAVLVFMLIAAALSVVAANENSLHFAENEIRSLWSAWKAEHSMEFEASEELKRLSVFWDNLEKIHQHNKSGASYTMAMNRFGALTSEEFKKQYASTEIPTSVDREYVDDAELDAVRAPPTMDWRKKGAVTPVKNQGQCGSCWSFSAAQAVEGANALAGNGLVVLSEKNLMDCSWKYGNMGCNGGLMDNAFKYVKKNGLATEKAYPYSPKSSHKCKKHKAAVHISGYKDVPANEKAFIKALSGRPLSIAIEADQQGFQFYKSGVFDGSCGDALDHGVLAVGYDKDSVIVKNSWGATWGDHGYIRLTRKNRNGGAGQCGMFSRASYPIGKKSESDFDKKNPRASMWTTILSKLRASADGTVLRGNPMHASCKGKWTFKGKKCADVSASIVANAKAMTGFANCKGEKCGYTVTSSSASKVSLVHETPVKHYKDDITLSFTDVSGDCAMDGYSTSETWYAHLDYGTNLCNIRNVVGKYDAEELGACTQASSADCSKY